MLVYSERGFRGFFAGCTCRAAWMGLGGFIFLGSFELAKTLGHLRMALRMSSFRPVFHFILYLRSLKSHSAHFLSPAIRESTGTAMPRKNLVTGEEDHTEHSQVVGHVQSGHRIHPF